MNRSLVLASLLAAIGFVQAEPPPVVLAIKGLDPVKLTQRREVAGKEDLTVTRGRFKYQFCSQETKAAFEKSPESYAIQWGGACGRMGPLSGIGNPDRWHIHDKKIFIFASEGCRNGFMAAPARYLEPSDELPEGTATQKKRGSELIALALKGFGGAEVVDDLKSIRQKFELAYPQKDKPDFLMNKSRIFAFPSQFREEDSYTGWTGCNVVTPKGGFSTSKNVAWPLESDVRTVLVKQFYREPVAILKARAEKGFFVVARRVDKIGDTTVELVEVAVHGATTTLAIDPKSGRILEARFQGRGSAGVGGVVKGYAGFKKVGKLIVPFEITTEIDGKKITSPKSTLVSIEVNERLPESLFSFPK